MQEASVWTTVEIELVSDRDHADPYRDVEVEAVFTGPDGQRISRPAFWDGGRTWRIRFAPTAAGEWTYRVACGEPDDAGLHDVRGSVVAVEGGGPDAPVYRHGFLRGADRHLVHADGVPFFWLGDTHWRFAWERWDAANKPGWSSQFRGTLDKRVDQGFTVYQTNLMSFAEASTSPCWVSGHAFSQLDVAYFQDVIDPRMAYIAGRGLLNAFGLAWHQAIDADVAGMVRLARYVVARYGSYPLVWTLAGEVAGYDPARRTQRLNGWRQVALAIRDADAYDHPRTAHLTAERPIPSDYLGEDWHTLTLNQLGHGDVDMSASHYDEYFSRAPRTPLVEGESMYEGLTSVEYAGRRTVTDTMVRHVAYRAIQSGCCGYTYGAQGCWNGAWDSPDMATMWGNLPWYDGVDLPGADQLGHLRRFYESLDWTALRPASDHFATEDVFNASLYYPLVTADDGARTVVVYFSETYRRGGGPAALVGLEAGAYRLQWFNPRTGRYSMVEDHAVPTDGRLVLPDKPDGSDWVLLARIS